MKIALVGDMNNNLFCLTRYLRDRGYDARLFYPVTDGSHFEPHCDTYDLDYQTYTEACDFSNHAFFKESLEPLKTKLKDYPFIISCGDAAAFLSRVGRKVNLYVPYGSDIYKYSHLPQEFSIIQKMKNRFMKIAGMNVECPNMSYGTMSKYLRLAIINADHLMMADTNEDLENKYHEINPAGKRSHYSIPFVYTPQYNPESITQHIESSYWGHAFKAIREKNDVVVFHHARQIWKRFANDYSFKGNDKLIKGFAQFIQHNPNVKACLMMTEYGPDVLASKELVRQLNIESHVQWFPKMYRKDIMVGLYYADICTGEFDKSWLMFGTIMEGMAMAKPILHYRNDALYQDSYPELYPIMNAREPDEIEYFLSDYVQNPEKYKQMGEVSKKWHDKYIVQVPLDEIQDMIDSHSKILV